jgi:iron complex transport system ATP-binding protein
VLVTHHVEEIPIGFTHALLLRGGRTVAIGPIDEAITAASLSETFGLSVGLERAGGRFAARAL